MFQENTNLTVTTKTAMNATNPPQSGTCGLKESTAAKTGKTAGYCVLMLMSFIGNSFVILVIYKNRSMRTAKNYLILSMALSDILFAAFTMPKNIVMTFSQRDRWFVSGLPGEMLCRFVPFIQDVATAVSILSMVAIAADRFYGLVYPMKKALFTGTLRRAVVVSTWVLAVFFHCPYLYIYKLRSRDDNMFCTSSWAPRFDDQKASQIYFLTISILLFFLPLTLVTILYSVITMKLKRQQFPGNQSIKDKKRMIHQNKSVLKMLVSVVVLFAVCWLPFNVTTYIALFHGWILGRVSPCGLETILFCVLFLAYSNSSLSPGLYFIFSQNFRRGLRNIVSSSGAGSMHNSSTKRTRGTPPHSPRIHLHKNRTLETEL